MFIVMIIVFVFLLILLLVFVVYFLFFVGRDYSAVYEQRLASGEIKNPLENLSVEEAVENFNEDFVYYFLVANKAYNLRDTILDDHPPHLEFNIDGEIYTGIIDDGEISVVKENRVDEDIIISTSKEEAVKMMLDDDYIEESVANGATEIGLVASKTKLAAKGYLDLYEEMTGEKILF